MSRQQLTQLFQEEMACYRRIDEQLISYSKALDSTLAAEILMEFSSIPVLLEQQAEIFSEILISPTLQNEHPDYFAFIEKVLNFDELETMDEQQLKLAIFKIILTEPGLRLIAALNEFNEKTGTQITLQYTNKNSMSVDQFQFFYPKHYYQHSPFLTPGKHIPLILTIDFISVAHEFIHILHDILGYDNTNIPFPLKTSNPTRWLYSHSYYKPQLEEYLTIEVEEQKGNSLCENTFRKTLDLSLRGGWMGAPLTKIANGDLKNLMWFIRKRDEKEILEPKTTAAIICCGMLNGKPNEPTMRTPKPTAETSTNYGCTIL